VRGYCRYRKNDRGGLLREAWPEDNTDFVTTKVTPVCDGLIIPRYPPPSLMLSRVYAEIRPDKAVVLDNRDPDGAKYVFPKGSKYAKRIDMHPLAVGLLRDAKRIYFGLEGCIKADAMLSAILRSREKASVLSVPSVTLWPIGPERTSWTSTCSRTSACGRSLLPGARSDHRPGRGRD
jgi:hypothetical protein